MEHLFTPFEIRDLHLDGRIVMPGLASFLFENDGSITDRTVEHYRRRASGGTAMVIVEACAVSPEGVVSPHQARIYDDRFVEGLARIATVLREEGAVPAVQLHHAGRQTSGRVIGRRPLAPSPLRCPTIPGEVEPLEVGEIGRIVRDFGDGAVRALQAGFDLVEIHGAHGYIVNQFLSGFSNVRQDAYGGDTAGRARFAVEIVREVRGRIGPNFPLSFKISAQEFAPGGLTVEESIRILALLLPEGIDIVQVSAGNDGTPEWICQPMFMEQACLADSAGKIRAAFGIPVMSVGRINDPELAEDLLRNGKADLVCMGRGLLADPELPRKARDGRLDEIRRCIACNTCMESIFRRGRVECLVNPSLGREQEMVLRPAPSGKKVMVIGGGPAGLEAAAAAARRGHEVHLYEKGEKVGGLLNVGSVPRYKRELKGLVRYQELQARAAGVRFHLGVRATGETVRAEAPDEVILAAGSVSVKPAVPGIDRSLVALVPEVLNGGPPPAWKAAVVVGGGATGCEVAHHLAEHGCRVTVVELLPEVAKGLETITRKVLLRELEERRVRLLTRTRLARVEEGGVWVAPEEGAETFLEADGVVVAVGNRPDESLLAELEAQGLPVHIIGDCREPRSARLAILEGAQAGRAV